MSEEKNYLIDRISENEKPEVKWTTINGNVFSIMGTVHRVWERSKHPQKREIVQEYEDRTKLIRDDNNDKDKYNSILYLSAYVYTRELEIEDDDDDEENEFGFDDEEDEE